MPSHLSPDGRRRHSTKGCAGAKDRYRRHVVHLSVAIGRFFEALLYALFSVAFWAALELLGVVLVLVALIVAVRRWARRKRR
jgi:hypothetical protein